MQKVTIHADDVHCSDCALSNLCLPVGMSQQDLGKLDMLVSQRLRVAKTGELFLAGDAVRAVYAIRSGSVKTQLEDASGHVQITGFFLPGEIVGLDGLLAERQLSHAIALEDTEVCVIDMDDVNNLCTTLPALQHQFQRLMSREIQRSHRLVMALGVLKSDQRLAAFLLNLSQRLAVLGYSSTRFVLRMSREEIGNYLGLTLETVSRLFSRFAQHNLIAVNQRDIELLDIRTLADLANIDCEAAAGPLPH
jgi:CRP/FNR family transcriptional regulator